MAHPTVTVLLPVLDEADTIDACLTSLAGQEYPGRLTIVVADGGSVDGTLERLGAWKARLPDLLTIDNPGRVQSTGLNLAASAADGEVLVRADAHTTYAPDYVARSVETLLTTNATAVGGTQRPEGTTAFGRAVAAAMTSPMTVGPARFRHADSLGEADTVYLGAFRRADFLELRGFRTLPSGVAEDADLYYRWRQAGGRILVDPAIRSSYRPRETPRGLWRQFYRYGIGKVDMLYLNGRWPSWRPAAPLALVLGTLAGILVGVGGSWWPLLALLGAWLLVVGTTGARIVRTPGMWMGFVAAAAIMQTSYGLGLLRGLARRPARVRRSVEMEA